MGYTRYLYKNLISSALTELTSRVGIITDAVRDAAGTAEITISGSFVSTAPSGCDYVIECESTSAGSSIGAALYKWSNSGGATWNATGVLTSTSAQSLSHGVSIQFADSTMTMITGDRWYFRGVLPNAPENVAKTDRDKVYNTTATSLGFVSTFQQGSATINCCAIIDARLSSGSSVLVRLMRSDNTAYYSTYVAQDKTNVVYFTDNLSSVVGMKLTATQSTGNISIGKIYIGDYWQPSRPVAAGSVRKVDLYTDSAQSRSGAEARKTHGTQMTLQLTHMAVPATDIANFVAMRNYLANSSGTNQRPVWVHLDSTDATAIYYMYLDDLEIVHRETDLFDVTLRLSEVVRSAS